MTAILRLQLDDKDPVRVNSAINQLAEFLDRGGGGGSGRTRLTADTIFYVATTGSDGNPGTSGSPFLTIQHAYDVIAKTLDTAGFNVTIQLADGTYASGVNFTSPWIGGGVLTITGNSSTPANVFVSVSSSCFVINSILPGTLILQHMKLKQTISDFSGACIMGNFPGNISFIDIIFDASFLHIDASTGSHIYASGAYSIIGGGHAHILSFQGGIVEVNAQTVTITGTPAFSFAFVYSTRLGTINFFTTTISGGTTGQRYGVDANSIIHTGGSGINYFPGTVAGVAATGGQYI